MTATPVSDRVFIIPTPAEKQIDGILIPENAVDHPVTGKVAFVGPAVTQMKTGDTVAFPQNYGTKLTLSEVEYIILQEHQVIATLNT